MTPDVPNLDALLRHFADLRDGRHGDAVTRPDKEEHFRTATGLLDPYARQALRELNEELLLGQGVVDTTGVQRAQDGSLFHAWTLWWDEQSAADIPPVTLYAHYGSSFHHPHLRGATVSEWPLNVFDDAQAAAELPTMRAIAAADLHNLVFQADFRIVPATMAGASGVPAAAHQH
ncbi:hypothetical protein [Streptomyces sp. ISL-94]|uniref:hypothetical protein n=1 Tax=Streptomyces sp. ISL-94 TaxID=2819190 RepID=UPI001BE89B16|nr:hypothetical protein [Streptomyces sp. ISL-94]MBT2479837.1 hypothetical protein [Streptomyces sp. ISL-94]